MVIKVKQGKIYDIVWDNACYDCIDNCVKDLKSYAKNDKNETISMSQFESLDSNRIKLKDNYLVSVNANEDQYKSNGNFKLNDVYMDQEGNYFYLNSNSKIKYALYFCSINLKVKSL